MDYRQHPANLGFTAEAKIDVFRQMVRIRRFEQAALKYYNGGKIGGWLILSIGQESIASGVRSLLGPFDHTISGPRGMCHALAAGMSMDSGMAELFGKTNGCSQGKGGAFSFYLPARNHWGCYALAAAQTPIAAGLAFGLKQREIPGAVVCFLGDGAVNQGVYHESLNLAGLFNLPVVYLIENNGFAMFTSQERSSRYTECLARRAEGYDIEWDKTGDGDLYELRARVWIALERARRESRPTVIEVPTYRYYGFSVADANHKKYRTPEEIDHMKATRDPINLWSQCLREEGLLTHDLAHLIEAEAAAEAANAIVAALCGEPPLLKDIMKHVYWETDNNTPASKIGRHFFD